MLNKHDNLRKKKTFCCLYSESNIGPLKKRMKRVEKKYAKNLEQLPNNRVLMKNELRRYENTG